MSSCKSSKCRDQLFHYYYSLKRDITAIHLILSDDAVEDGACLARTAVLFFDISVFKIMELLTHKEKLDCRCANTFKADVNNHVTITSEGRLP